VTVLTLAFQYGIFAEPEESFLYYFILQTVASAGLCYRVVSCEKQGHSSEYTFDVLALNWAVQVLSLYTAHAWKLYYVIPAFALYKVGKMVAGYVFSPKQGEEAPDAAEIARLEKKQRKQERQAARGGIAVQRR